MSGSRMQEIRALQGRQVGVALTDGTRLDDATLVSACAGPDGTLWLFCAGADVFVPAAAVLDAWEWPGGGRRAA